jgi:hypothetical protein
MIESRDDVTYNTPTEQSKRTPYFRALETDRSALWLAYSMVYIEDDKLRKMIHGNASMQRSVAMLKDASA